MYYFKHHINLSMCWGYVDRKCCVLDVSESDVTSEFQCTFVVEKVFLFFKVLTWNSKHLQ